MARKAMVQSIAKTPQQRALVSPRETGPSVSGRRTHMAHECGVPAAVRVASESQDPLLTSCDQSVVCTIFSSRAPSTRLLYTNRWELFSQWCVAHGEVPETCSVVAILLFLQSVLDRKAPCTLAPYVATISAADARVDNQTVGSHDQVRQFLKGAQRLQPPRHLRAPSWDLQVVLRSLCLPSFEPLSQADLTRLSMKTAFLLAIATAKQVGELHALSVSQQCLRWHVDGSGVVLWPNPSFLPKRLSPHHVNQSIELAAFNPPGSQRGAEIGQTRCARCGRLGHMLIQPACVRRITSLSVTGAVGSGLPRRNRDSPTGLWMRS